MRSTTFTCLGAIALAFSSGCSDAKKHDLNELKTIAVDYGNTIVERSQAASSQIVERIKAIIPAVEKRDLEQVKSICSDLDASLGTNAMTVYYQVFAIEVKSGPEAARQYLAEKLSDPAISDSGKRPLNALNAFFKAKGTISTKDAVLVVLAFALESKFPHGGAILVVPFMDNPKGPGTEGMGDPPNKPQPQSGSPLSGAGPGKIAKAQKGSERFSIRSRLA